MDDFKLRFINNFIVDNRWKYLSDGLMVTLKVTFFALIIGIVIGYVVAVIRATSEKTIKPKEENTSILSKTVGVVIKFVAFLVLMAGAIAITYEFGAPFLTIYIICLLLIKIIIGFRKYDKNRDTVLKFIGKEILIILDLISRVYLTIIRGTPVAVQLMIIYFVIFASTNVDKSFVAIIAFGLNSGAYVAEIVRSGIMSIDEGQFEAGRSLGFNYIKTMRFIILPQAFKNILPALANEFIVLLKETSIASLIALQDLTKGANIIMGRTYDPFMPLLAAAAIYLVLVMGLSSLVTKLERRLRTSAR